MVEDFRTADGSLVLERFYNSRGYSGSTNNLSRYPLGLGLQWHFWFQQEVHFLFNSSVVRAELATAQGGSFTFQRNASTGAMEPLSPNYGIQPQTDYKLELIGTWPSNLNDLSTSSSQWRMTDSDDAVWVFETYIDPALTNYVIAHPLSVTSRDGLQLTFTYGTYKQLTAITDGFGKSITFDWLLRDRTAAGGTGINATAISRATLPDGTKLEYIYDSPHVMTITGFAIDYTDRLIRVEHRDASNNLLNKTEYLHDHSIYKWNITGIKDAAGTQRWTVDYDSDGHAITSKGPNDADKTTVSYGTVAAPSFTRTVTNALGKQTVYTWDWAYTKLNLISIAGSASTNCPADNSTLTYASNFIQSFTDAEGRVTRYTRNSLGQETQRVEAYGTGLAKTISTTWHSTLKVPTRSLNPASRPI